MSNLIQHTKYSFKVYIIIYAFLSTSFSLYSPGSLLLTTSTHNYHLLPRYPIFGKRSLFAEISPVKTESATLVSNTSYTILSDGQQTSSNLSHSACSSIPPSKRYFWSFCSRENTTLWLIGYPCSCSRQCRLTQIFYHLR